MEDYQVQHPVVMTVFKRYDCTKQVFEQVKKVKPKKLYVIADGPRNEEEKVKCEKVRKIFSDIDWDCELITRFLDENYGCAKNSYTGYKWVFSQEEAAIVLEDDCVPNLSFFKFCDEMLDKYKDDERIYQICGSNINGQYSQDNKSYFFHRFGSVWGWASWKRVWDQYDFEMKKWEEPGFQSKLRRNIPFRHFVQKALNYDYYHENANTSKVSVWTAQYEFIWISQSGYCITPAANLINNIGDGEDSAHMRKKDKLCNRKTYEMEFPLSHPKILLCDVKFDDIVFNKICYGTYFNRVRSMIKYLLVFKHKYKI